MMTVLDRFEAKYVRSEVGCWEWTGSRAGGRPGRRYGYFYLNGRRQYAHRVAYEMFVGPIPEGLTIDHLCRNRGCVNPDHLEPVTNRENSLRARRTHCVHGHPFDAENTGVQRASGRFDRRRCLTCSRLAQRRYQAKNKVVS